MAVTRGVVTCPEPLAAQAGAEVLRQGGNALEAAIATALAQGVANPNMCGIGGVGGLVYHEAATGETTFVSSTSSAPARARPEMWEDLYESRSGTTWQVRGKVNLLGYQAQLVPGLLRALEHAFRRFGSGRVSWADLFAPAIRIAEEGYAVPAWLWEKWKPGGTVGGAAGFADAMPFLSHNRAAAEIYAPKGRAIRPGERLVQRDYGSTLRRVAEEGADVFYTGEIARAIAEDFARNDGLLTYEDLAAVQAKELPALRSSYREYAVCTSHAPSLGPTFLEMANILEGYDLRSLGWNTPAYLDRLSRVMHLAYSDRLRHMADPSVFPVPVDRLISKGHAAELRALIDEGKDHEYVAESQPDPENTTSLTTMDGEGNAVSMVHSSNVGAGIVTPGLGFLWNSHMWMFNPLPGYRNSVAPGRQPISGTSAFMFLREGRPLLALSSPGGSRGTASCIQVACNILEFNLEPQAAVSAGRIFAEDQHGVVRVDDGIPMETRAALVAMGKRLEVGRNGIVSASYRHPDSGELMGGSDPRSGAGITVVE